MKRAYYYLFYKFYRFWDNVSGDSWSDFKALVFIGSFDICLLFSILIHIQVIFKKATILDLPRSIFIMFYLCIFALNYFTFSHHDRWRKYVLMFDKLPKRINRIGGWIVFGVVLFVIVNLFFSFYLMSQIDWSQYQ